MSATLAVDLRKAGATDDLQHTVNYAEVFRCDTVRPWDGRCDAACRLLVQLHMAGLQDVSDCCSDVATVVEGPPRLLIESVATAIADIILQRHPLVQVQQFHACCVS